MSEILSKLVATFPSRACNALMEHSNQQDVVSIFLVPVNRLPLHDTLDVALANNLISVWLTI
jgi:hypothetical protein